MPQEFPRQSVSSLGTKHHPVMGHTHRPGIASFWVSVSLPFALDLILEDISRRGEGSNDMIHEFWVRQVKRGKLTLCSWVALAGSYLK